MSDGVTLQGRGGTQECTAGVKGLVLMSFSISSTCRHKFATLPDSDAATI